MLQAASTCSRMFKGASPLALGNPEFIGEFINIFIYIERERDMGREIG